jgi:Protein of unknown function (DUF1566)
MKHYLKYLLTISVAAYLSAVTVSAHADSAGTVMIAGKEWMRCSLGQTWNGNTCIGDPYSFTIEKAKAAAEAANILSRGDGKGKWRVPSIRELESLRECSTGFSRENADILDGDEPVSRSCNQSSDSPTLNQSVFPSTPRSLYWSISPYAKEPNKPWSWLVSFGSGGLFTSVRDSYNYVRLVR